MWDEKEKRLMDHILQLQNLVMRLTSQMPAAPTPQAATTPALNPPLSIPQTEPTSSVPPSSPQSPATPTAQAERNSQAVGSSQFAGKAPERKLSVLEQASQYMPPEPQPFQLEPLEEFAPLEVMLVSIGN